MPRKKIEIPKEILSHLYHVERMTPVQLGERFGCSFSTISNRLRDYHIQIKTPAAARARYPKSDFNGTEELRSYMVGFRQGDLNVYKPYKNSEIIVARCSTTDPTQISVMQEIFSPFGHVQVGGTGRVRSVNCSLNKSFSFLIPKDEIPDFVRVSVSCTYSYIAGYVDAEANFIINQGRARFKLDTYDKPILEWIHTFLCQQGIRSKFSLIAKKGDFQGETSYKFNGDLWRINVNEANSLKQFIDRILPFMKHAGRIGQVKLMLNNIEDRRRYGSI